MRWFASSPGGPGPVRRRLFATPFSGDGSTNSSRVGNATAEDLTPRRRPPARAGVSAEPHQDERRRMRNLDEVVYQPGVAPVILEHLSGIGGDFYCLRTMASPPPRGSALGGQAEDSLAGTLLEASIVVPLQLASPDLRRRLDDFLQLVDTEVVPFDTYQLLSPGLPTKTSGVQRPRRTAELRRLLRLRAVASHRRGSSRESASTPPVSGSGLDDPG